MKNIIGLLIVAALFAGCKKGSSSHAPGVATLLTPVKDQICTTGSVVSDTVSDVSFTWDGGQNADSYQLTIKNLLTQAVTTKQVNATDAIVGLSRNTPYSWYVTSKSSHSSAITKTDVWKFYNAGSGVVTYAPYPAEIIAPVLGQIMTTVAGKVSLSWKGSVPSGKIVGYSVYFGPSNNPDLFRSNITDSSITDIAVSPNTTYYWHVVTIDANYNISDSGLYNFYVKQ